MSKLKTKIDEKRIARLKMIMSKEKITQNELAEKIGMTQQNLSRIMCKKQGLTESLAIRIIDKYPDYSVAWLLGYDEVRWISVKDRLPKEHDSIFANHTHLSKHLWAKESDNVIVYVRFPDGTGRSTEGRLQDGKWWTRVSPMLEPVVTHWMPLPTPPEVNRDED